MTIMTTAQAEDYLYRHDTRARSLTRMTRTKLLELRNERDRAAGFTRQGGAWSKDELVNHLLDAEFPLDKTNEAIHGKYHVTGRGGSSACEYCHPHNGGWCDCSPRALERLAVRMACPTCGSQAVEIHAGGTIEFRPACEHDKTGELIAAVEALLEPIGSQRHQTAGCQCAECLKIASLPKPDIGAICGCWQFTNLGRCIHTA